MEQTQLQQLSQSVQKWVVEAAELSRQLLKQPLQVATKLGPNDLVTNADKATQDFLISKITSDYPDANIVAEEGTDFVPDNWQEGLSFFIDPIDGTSNFVKQHDNFAIMIGVYENGVGIFGIIYDVIADHIYWGGPDLGVYLDEQALPAIADVELSEGLIAVNSAMLMANQMNLQTIGQFSAGIRVYGSAGITIGLLLQGKLISYISYLAPWDIAAGYILLTSLGYKVGQFNGNRISLTKKEGIIIAPPKTWHQIEAFAV